MTRLKHPNLGNSSAGELPTQAGALPTALPPAPLAPGMAQAPVAVATLPTPHEQQDRSATILVIENEDNNRFLMEQILRLAGYTCLSASNGFEGLALLDSERVDLVLTDLSMPLLDGYQTTELMRRRPHAATLPIIAVTAHAMGAERDLAHNAGCTDVLVKPYRPRDLVRLLEHWLDDARHDS